MDDDAFKRSIEEYKELGHEYRYRDQMMVQEFGLTMIAVGALLNVLLTKDFSLASAIIVKILGMIFLFILTLHLRNTNQDRRAALRRKISLQRELGFQDVHQNPTGEGRLSAPRMMFRFTFVVALSWTVWTVISVIHFPN